MEITKIFLVGTIILVASSKLMAKTFRVIASFDIGIHFPFH
jgi:hypothetical protein